MFRIREMSGICPQHDVLYDLLNCVEHLELYASLKGVPKNLIKQKTNELLEKVGMIDSKNTLAKNLSGGQKRKLSIAIALIGDPKVKLFFLVFIQ
jgi:ATP-binding cassette, subfamily A (ABC1), member 5